MSILGTALRYAVELAVKRPGSKIKVTVGWAGGQVKTGIVDTTNTMGSAGSGEYSRESGSRPLFSEDGKRVITLENNSIQWVETEVIGGKAPAKAKAGKTSKSLRRPAPKPRH